MFGESPRVVTGMSSMRETEGRSTHSVAGSSALHMLSDPVAEAACKSGQLSEWVLLLR